MAASLSQNQKLFASALSQSTGLDPRTVEAWMIAEEPAGAQSGYQGTQDWLNVGITDSGPKGATNSVWSDPVSAARATANWMKGTWADPGFGTASSGIQEILKTRGQSPQAQLAAIAGSGWASSGYGGAAKLQSLLDQVDASGLPGVKGGPVSPTTLGQVKNVTATFPGQTPSVAPTGPNIFNTLAGLERTRQTIIGDNAGPDPTQSGWDALANLFGSQQSTSTSNPQSEVSVVKQVVNDGSKAPPGAQKILGMAMQAIGGPYSQAHHASAFTQTASQVKAGGTDCSGFVSWLMGPDGLGIWPQALATPDIPKAPGIVSGRGNNITIWNNPLPGNAGHVFIEINGKFFQSAGGGTGIQPISDGAAQSMIAHGDNGNPYYALHPKGY